MFGVGGIPPKVHFSEQSGKDTFVVHTLVCSYQWFLIHCHLESIFYCMLFRKD